MFIDHEFLINCCVIDINKLLGELGFVLSLSFVLLIPTIFMSGKGLGQTGRTLGAGALAGGVNALVNQGINRWLGNADGNKTGNNGNNDKSTGNKGNTGGNNAGNTGNTGGTSGAGSSGK